jgi:hypothetical protein
MRQKLWARSSSRKRRNMHYNPVEIFVHHTPRDVIVPDRSRPALFSFLA